MVGQYKAARVTVDGVRYQLHPSGAVFVGVFAWATPIAAVTNPRVEDPALVGRVRIEIKRARRNRAARVRAGIMRDLGYRYGSAGWE